MLEQNLQKVLLHNLSTKMMKMKAVKTKSELMMMKMVMAETMGELLMKLLRKLKKFLKCQ